VQEHGFAFTFLSLRTVVHAVLIAWQSQVPQRCVAPSHKGSDKGPKGPNKYGLKCTQEFMGMDGEVGGVKR
jgi:hypothetical protein